MDKVLFFNGYEKPGASLTDIEGHMDAVVEMAGNYREASVVPLKINGREGRVFLDGFAGTARVVVDGEKQEAVISRTPAGWKANGWIVTVGEDAGPGYGGGLINPRTIEFYGKGSFTAAVSYAGESLAGKEREGASL